MKISRILVAKRLLSGPVLIAGARSAGTAIADAWGRSQRFHAFGKETSMLSITHRARRGLAIVSFYSQFLKASFARAAL